jgi:GT2 family glycosyltransferase
MKNLASVVAARQPSVSVVIPARNEVGFIEDCVDALFAQDFIPERYEVIIVDGMSDDGTRAVLDRLRAKEPRLRVIDNPRQQIAPALNLGVQAATGDVIIRIDGHTRAEPDFVRSSLKLLADHPEAWLVGGPRTHKGRNAFARGVAIAMTSPVGVGGANHNFKDYEGHAETIAEPAFHRWVFERVGMYDERFIRNEDDELNLRIHKAGGKIFVSPTVKHDYWVRDSVKGLFRQYLQYGYWKVEVMRKHGQVVAPRHLVPLVFVLGAPVCAVAAAVLPPPVSAVPLAPLAAYATLLSGFALRTLVREKSAKVAASAAAAAAIMHAAYGVGTLAGILAPPGRSSSRLRMAMEKMSR